MSNFWARTITGLSMVFILLAGLYFNEWIFAILFFVVAVLGVREFYSLIASEQYHPQKLYGTISSAILYAILIVNHYRPLSLDYFNLLYIPFLLPIPLFFLSFIIELFRNRPNPLVNIAYTVSGIFYIAFPLVLMNLMNDRSAIHYLGFPVYLTGYFILTWTYDTGAYLYGKQFGKNKFFERISPKKTWEGTIAGAIITLCIATGLAFLTQEFRLYDWLALASIIIVFGTFGDLVESLIKRSLNIKDSGNILPGHGGILDRFDTFFISAPFVFLYFIIRFP